MNPSPRQQRLPGLDLPDDPSETSADRPATGATGQPQPTDSAVPDPPQEPAAVAELPPNGLAGKTVYVVDANSLIFQVFYALPDMTSTSGEPVNAVYGFVRDMLFLFEEKQPD